MSSRSCLRVSPYWAGRPSMVAMTPPPAAGRYCRCASATIAALPAQQRRRLLGTSRYYLRLADDDSKEGAVAVAGSPVAEDDSVVGPAVELATAAVALVPPAGGPQLLASPPFPRLFLPLRRGHHLLGRPRPVPTSRTGGPTAATENGGPPTVTISLSSSPYLYLQPTHPLTHSLFLPPSLPLHFHLRSSQSRRPTHLKITTVLLSTYFCYYSRLGYCVSGDSSAMLQGRGDGTFQKLSTAPLLFSLPLLFAFGPSLRLPDLRSSLCVFGSFIWVVKPPGRDYAYNPLIFRDFTFLRTNAKCANPR
jgi:hypothetical protein